MKIIYKALFSEGNDGVIFFPSFPVVAPYHSQPAWTNPLDWIYYGTFNTFGFPGYSSFSKS
jgi:hypothetical protein